MDSPTLARAASRGDRAAVEALLQQHLGRLRAFLRARCGAMLRGKESCSDLVQTVCREVLQDVGDQRFASEAHLVHWLFQRAEHKVIDRARYWQASVRDAGRETPADDGDDESAFVTWLTPSRELVSRERMQRIQQALEQLPPDHREAILLHRLVELPYPEVASAMGRSEGAVRNLVYRGLARLSLLLHADDDAPRRG